MQNAENSSRLYVKSYFAASVDEALERARVELGPDALLLNEREAPPEARHLGAWEVVFGVRPSLAPSAPVIAAAPAADSVADLRQSLQELREMVTRIMPGTPSDRTGSPVAAELAKVGLEPALAAEIDRAVQQRIRNSGVLEISRGADGSRPRAKDLVREAIAELESRFEVAPELGRICALIGPPGSGKTSTLVKLAIVHGLGMNRPVRLVSIDSHRIAAAEQLRTYAGILGVPFKLAETTSALAAAISDCPGDTLLLIDTPGYSAASMRDSGEELAAFFRSRQEIDTHLVLTASMRQADMRRASDQFLAFGPSKILFSRLDETDSTAAMVSEAMRCGKPLSFFSTGQLMPEDLESATKARLIDPLVQELPQWLEAVA
jgi:flagellar biosynthesis protein FlhF